MSKMMVLGVKGETGLWLVDFAAGTVTALEGKREDYIATADGTDDTIGADVAVAFEPKEAAFSGLFYKTPALDVAVALHQQEAAFSGLYYKTPQLDVAVTLDPQEAAFSGHYYKTPQLDVAVALEPEEAAFSGQFYKTPQTGFRAQ